jgi:poly(3-hydroxybutyrate) depolymerase
MSKNKVVSIIFLIGMSINAQTINLRGVVSNSAGKPVSNAIVSLARQKIKDTTDTEGKYAFTGTVATLPAIVPHTNDISLNNGVLEFAISTPSPMKVEFFDLKGKLLKQVINLNTVAGKYQFDISRNCQTSKVLVIRATIGISEVSFKYMPLNGGKYAISPMTTSSTISIGGGMTAAAAVVDTVKVTATGFKEKSTAITSLNQELNVSLDSTGSALKNDPAPSLGCGKTLGAINKSGTYSIRSSGSNRTFIINIPANYDKNKPYRLIFGMHCMGGSAAKVAGTTDQSRNFYSIKTQADKDNIQCIYVAPQGDEGGTWQGEPDRTFFFDLQKMLKDTLCIDTTRVFSVGFSFGAMFTYALSLKYPKILRAAACNAPANYVMDQPPNQHIPLAYVQTTGTQDGTCPWVQGGTNGGKYCLLQHATDNGCNTNITIQLANSGKHVVTEFTGCKDGYPVKFCSHNGGHECNKTDQGSSVDWIPVEFWEFFKRF